MTAINLNPAQVKILLSALRSALDDYHNEIHRTLTEDEPDAEAYRSMMEEYEQLAGTKALIEAQTGQH